VAQKCPGAKPKKGEINGKKKKGGGEKKERGVNLQKEPKEKKLGPQRRLIK